MSALGQKQTFLDVRFSLNDVRFTPESGHVQCTRQCPLCANRRRRSYTQHAE
jgi:hypothetical protein